MQIGIVQRSSIDCLKVSKTVELPNPTFFEYHKQFPTKGKTTLSLPLHKVGEQMQKIFQHPSSEFTLRIACLCAWAFLLWQHLEHIQNISLLSISIPLYVSQSHSVEKFTHAYNELSCLLSTDRHCLKLSRIPLSLLFH